MQSLRKRFPLFHRGPVQGHLLLETKSVDLQIKSKLSPELVHELAEFFSWCEQHLEVHSILIRGTAGPGELLLTGLCPEWARERSQAELSLFLKSVQELTFRMLHLPQTVILDLGAGAKNIGAELAMGADIILGQMHSQIHFAHADMGLVPSCGGIALLGSRVGEARARAWTLSPLPISARELQEAGAISGIYDLVDRDQVITTLLQGIARQAPVARIQTKAAFAARLEEAVLWSLKNEKRFAAPALAVGDWARAFADRAEGTLPEFTQARNLAQTLRPKDQPKERPTGPTLSVVPQ